VTIKSEKRFWIAVYGFTASILLVAMGVFGWLAWTSRNEPGIGLVAGARPLSTATNPIPDERYRLLAAFEAPEYEPRPGSPKLFQLAMSKYVQKDYTRAAAALQGFADANPEFTAAKFYLGISLLLAGDRIAGIQELRDVTEIDNSPFQARARFYLAKALIGEHDIPRAEKQLEDLIAQHGSMEAQAAVLLSQIRPAS